MTGPCPSAASLSRDSCRSLSGSQLPGPGTGHSSSPGHRFSGTHTVKLAEKQLAGNRIGEHGLSRKEVLERGVRRDPLPISQTGAATPACPKPP